MDPASVTLILGLLEFALSHIKKFCEERKARASAIQNLYSQVKTVSSVVAPLLKVSRRRPLNKVITDCLQELRFIIHETMDHLRAWSDESSTSKWGKFIGFLFPESVLEEIQNDADRLSMNFNFLSTALSAQNLLGNMPKASIKDNVSTPTHQRSQEAQAFWDDEIGNDVSER